MNAPATATELPRAFESLAALQERHTRLVEEIGSDILAPANRERVTTFIRDGAATGAILNARDDRAAAQGLINFWVARLGAAARTKRREASQEPGGEIAPQENKFATAGEEDAGAALPFEETLLATFDPSTLQAAAAAADAWLRTVKESDRWLPRRVMLRLVRLRATEEKFDPVPTVRAALYDLDAPDKVDATLAGLAAAGVVRVQPGESPEMDRVVLRSPNLLTEWGTLAGWLNERSHFRHDVASWDNAGRPARLLYDRPRLEEVWYYHDRNRLERRFSDASRDRLRRRNDWNRVLKWVFLGLAAAILIGWITAAVFYFRARTQARAANDANVTLRQKQQLTNIRLFVRALGELIAAHTPAEQTIAKNRWDIQIGEFKEQYQNDPQAYPFLELNLDELHRCATCQEGPTRVSPTDLAEIRRLRNSVIANEQLLPVLLSMRAVSYGMVKLSASRAVAELKANKPYSEVEPYAQEFWTQYWGEMLLVEGRDVESAMVAFGDTLARIQDEAERPDPGTTTATLTQAAGDKGKQLAQEFPRLKLNASSFAQVDKRASELNVPKADRARLQEHLYQIRKDQLSRPVIDPQLVSELEQHLSPLRAALDAELREPTIPPYTDAAPR